MTAAQSPLALTADGSHAAVELQAMLIDLVDLALIGKQAHWNVVGPHFRTVHSQLDEFVGEWHAMADEVAERAVALGAAADAQAETVAGTTQLVPLPAGHLRDDFVVGTIADRIDQVVVRTRERIEAVADDAVTEDLMIAVAAMLEKQRWMLRAATQH